MILESLFQEVGAELEKGKFEVLVLDNASTDNTVSIIKNFSKFQLIKFSESQTNRGYAKGINLLAKKAQGELMIVINPDAELVGMEFEKIEKEFETNEKLSVAGFSIKNKKGIVEKNAGRFYNPLTILAFTFGMESVFKLRYAPNKKTRVDYVSGGFIALRRSIFEELGGFDESYFMYVEDMDLCFRAYKNGYDVYFLPYGEIIHQGQGSSSREFAVVNIYKGLITFYSKNKGGIEEYYARNLLSIKAALIIFIGTLLGKKELVGTYRRALKAIS